MRSVHVEFPGTVHGFDQYLGVSRRITPAGRAATDEIRRVLASVV